MKGALMLQSVKSPRKYLTTNVSALILTLQTVAVTEQEAKGKAALTTRPDNIEMRVCRDEATSNKDILPFK